MLFSPLDIRGTRFANRAWISPMCQYSASEGVPNEWHLVHYGSLAVGKPGLVIAESTAILPEGRISATCTGLWNEEQVTAWGRVTAFCHEQGIPIGVQLSHAGRKASTEPPWHGEGDLAVEAGGWTTVAPSPLPYGSHRAPLQLSLEDIAAIVEAFAASAQRAVRAGFDVIEIHAAHGYLLHQFLSPLTNERTDEYGGTPEHRMRLTLEVCEAIRAAIGPDMPLFVRISATDWVPGGFDIEDAVALSTAMAKAGVDLVDVSSGGLVPDADIPSDMDYQVTLSQVVRERAGILTAAVGRIVDPAQAEGVLLEGQADAIFIARAALANPRWPLHASDALEGGAHWPVRYERAQGLRSWTGNTAQSTREGER